MTTLATITYTWIACSVACFAWMAAVTFTGQRRDRDAAGFDVAADEACALTEDDIDIEFRELCREIEW